MRDGHPGIEKLGSMIFLATKINKKIKLISVMMIPSTLEKYKGRSVNEVRPLMANLKYFIGENVEVPA